MHSLYDCCSCPISLMLIQLSDGAKVPRVVGVLSQLTVLISGKQYPYIISYHPSIARYFEPFHSFSSSPVHRPESKRDLALTEIGLPHAENAVIVTEFLKNCRTPPKFLSNFT